MILQTESRDADELLPMLVTALAANTFEQWVDLTLRGGTERGGYLIEADELEVRIQDESGDEPWGETHPWHEVVKVEIS